MFTGTAEPGSFVTLSDETTVLSSSIVANSSGIWTFDNTANVLGDGDHEFLVTSTDLAGNFSAASSTVTVSIDTIGPAIPNPPTLLAADDRGIQGDNRTNLKRPKLTGATEAGAFVEILNSFNAVLGTATADGSGNYVVMFGVDLADDIHTVRIRASDPGGNAQVSGAYSLTIDTTRPVVQSVAPAGTTTSNSPQIVVTFNNDDLNNTTLGNPAFAGSVQNPANFMLIGDGADNVFGTGDDRNIDLSNSTFAYDVGADRLTITLMNAGAAPIQLPNDSYRLTINATTSVQDIAGNSILGNSDFVHPFVVAVPPPRAISVRSEGTRKVIQRVIIAFSGPMDRATADADSNYELRDAGKDKKFDTGDDKIIALAQAGCSTPFGDCTEVVVQALRGFSRKRPVRLTVRDNLLDVGGTKLDGNADGLPGGNFVTTIGPSSTRRTPRQSSQVAAQVVDRVLETDTSGAPRGGRADGRSHAADVLDTDVIAAARGRRADRLADDVDELLDTGEDIGTMMADTIADGLSRKR
jgi:hypothetical protein